jgi:hypothetical protein
MKQCEKVNSVSIRLIAYSVVCFNAHEEYLVKGQHTGAQLVVDLKAVLDRFELTDS